MKMNKKGFTLAELLIVIAIIAILIAIAIPAFSAQLENARLQADHANLRSAYAVAQTATVMGKAEVGIESGYVYCTDGTFKANTATNAITMQAATGKHQGNATSAPESCKACVVNCSEFATKDAKIYIVGNDTDGYNLKNTPS